MDKLEELLSMQKKLNDYIIEKRGLQDIPKDEWIRKQILAMLSEMAEVLDEVNFKWWKSPKPLDDKLIKYELVDILHFLLSMFLSMGMDADEIYKIYLDKNKENFNRQDGTSKEKNYNT